MASRTKNSMKVSNKKAPVKDIEKTQEAQPVAAAPEPPKPAAELAKPAPEVPKAKAVKKTARQKSKATSPEDAIMQSSAVDPDLEKAVITQKPAGKKSPSPKAPKKTASKNTRTKKTPAKKAAPKKTKNSSK